VIEKKRVTVEVVKHGNLKPNSITGMLSEVFYILNVESVVRLCVVGLGAIEKTRVIVELAKHGNPKMNSITGMLS